MILFEIGSPLFWALLSVASILLIWATETRSGIWATIVMFGTIALLYFLGDKGYIQNLLVHAKDHPLSVVVSIIGYFIVGTVWSVVKWYFFLIKQRDYYKDNGFSPRVPQVSEYKSTFLLWMMYWPFSGIWTIIDSPVKRGFSFIFGKIKGRMQQMADKIFEPIMEKKKEQV